MCALSLASVSEVLTAAAKWTMTPFSTLQRHLSCAKCTYGSLMLAHNGQPLQLTLAMYLGHLCNNLSLLYTSICSFFAGKIEELGMQVTVVGKFMINKVKRY